MQPLFRFEPPSAPLRGWVRQHQIIRFGFGPGAVIPAKPYWPRPAACLAFYLRDRERIEAFGSGQLQEKSRAAVIGQPTMMTLRYGGPDYSVYQIEMEPGALHRLTGLPIDELTDAWIDAEAVFPANFRALVRQLEDLEEPAAMIAAVEAYLLGLVMRATRPRAAADWVAAALLSGAPSIDRLAADVALSSRQLHRQFVARNGVGPKLLARIARFDRAVRMKNAHPSETLLNIAIDAGFHDHQHLARDVRAFTGMNPSAFFAQEDGAPERLFDLRET